FSWVSNQLGTPKILFCPSDSRIGRHAASNFGASSNGGFMNLAYQNNAISYALSTHSFFDYPQSLFSGGHNVGGLTPGISCALCTNGAYQAEPSFSGWTNSVHGECGNVVRTDGQVSELSTAGLHATFSNAVAAGPYAFLHFLFPQ